jgi:hypothetical protein
MVMVVQVQQHILQQVQSFIQEAVVQVQYQADQQVRQVQVVAAQVVQ